MVLCGTVSQRENTDIALNVKTYNINILKHVTVPKVTKTNLGLNVKCFEG